MKQGTNTFYLHNDHLGSTYLVSDQGLSMSSRHTYFAFGAPRTTEGSPPTDYGFTGQKLDASDGLMYYGRTGSRLGLTSVERDNAMRDHVR